MALGTINPEDPHISGLAKHGILPMHNRTVSWNVKPRETEQSYWAVQTDTHIYKANQPVPVTGDKVHMLLKTQLQVLEKAEKGAP